MADLKKVKNILHLVIWILSVVAGGLLANIGSNNDSEVLNEFVDAVVFGEIFITTILFAMIFFEEEVPEKTFYLLTIGAAVIYLIAGIVLVFDHTDNNNRYRDINNRYRDNNNTLPLISGVLAIAIGAIFLFEFIASLTKKEMLD